MDDFVKNAILFRLYKRFAIQITETEILIKCKDQEMIDLIKKIPDQYIKIICNSSNEKLIKYKFVVSLD